MNIERLHRLIMRLPHSPTCNTEPCAYLYEGRDHRPCAQRRGEHSVIAHDFVPPLVSCDCQRGEVLADLNGALL